MSTVRVSRWTVRGSYRVNQDVQPYALFTYIVNNQTGVRTFFTRREHTTMIPQNVFSQTPDDIDTGLGLTRLDAGVSAVSKAVIVGSGGSASGMALHHSQRAWACTQSWSN